MTDDEIVSLLREHPDRAVTAVELEDEIEITKQALNQRLNNLADEGRVRKKTVGANAVVWWPAERQEAD